MLLDVVCVSSLRLLNIGRRFSPHTNHVVTTIHEPYILGARNDFANLSLQVLCVLLLIICQERKPIPAPRHHTHQFLFGIGHIIVLPLRWSTSCWKTRANKALAINSPSSLSRFTRYARDISISLPGNERHPSFSLTR